MLSVIIPGSSTTTSAGSTCGCSKIHAREVKKATRNWITAKREQHEIQQHKLTLVWWLFACLKHENWGRLWSRNYALERLEDEEYISSKQKWGSFELFDIIIISIHSQHWQIATYESSTVPVSSTNRIFTLADIQIFFLLLELKQCESSHDDDDELELFLLLPHFSCENMKLTVDSTLLLFFAAFQKVSNGLEIDPWWRQRDASAWSSASFSASKMKNSLFSRSFNQRSVSEPYRSGASRA